MCKLRATIRDACLVHNELPSDRTSTASGRGMRSFCTQVENTIFISPRLSNGTHPAYITIEDVCLTAMDAYALQHLCARTQVRLDSESGKIIIMYTFDAGAVPKKIRVRIHVCGVLLVDVSARKAFSGRTGGRLQSQHAFAASSESIAIRTSTRLVISGYEADVVVFTLPDFQLARTFSYIDSHRDNQLIDPRGVCFTDAGTLLIADYYNNRVQHRTLEGIWIASYPVLHPSCVASRGNVAVIGKNKAGGVHIISLERERVSRVGATMSEWLNGNDISAITFVSATTLAIAVCTTKTVGLYTLEGVLKRQLAVDIVSYGLAVCADDCLLVSDQGRKRVRVFSKGGVEIVTSSFAEFTFEENISTVVVHAERAYVLEEFDGGFFSETRISVFE